MQAVMRGDSERGTWAAANSRIARSFCGLERHTGGGKGDGVNSPFSQAQQLLLLVVDNRTH
jgi:hypothetical protein